MGEWKGGNTNRLNEQRGSDSPHLNLKIGGGNEIRTHDLCSAIAALSQLSYTPGR